MKPGTFRLLGSTVAVFVAVTLSGVGCGDTGDRPSGEKASQTITPTGEEGPTRNPLPDAPMRPTHECPMANYVAIGYSGLTGDDLVLYEEVEVCSRGDTGTIKNTSDGVWVVGAAGGVQPTLLRQTLQSKFFRSIENRAMTPMGLWVMAPQDIYQVHNVGTISWAPHHSLTAAWGIQKLSLDRLAGKSADYVDRTLKGQTPHSTAVAQCAWATYSAADAAGQLDNASEAVDYVQSGLKVAQTGVCLEPTQRADDAARAAGQVELPPAKSDLPQRVTALSGRADTGLDFWKIVSNAPLGCIHLKIKVNLHFCPPG